MVVMKLTIDESTAARFWAKVDFLTAQGECWRWTACLCDGYGQFGIRSDNVVYAHRLTYELLVGPIPEGLELDHLCRNRWCVNPGCLEPVTHLENIRRGNGDYNARKTHCKHGHEFTEENTYRRPCGRRQCRACRKRYKRAYRRRRAECAH